VYVEAQSLACRGLVADDLLIPVRSLDSADIAGLMDGADVVLSF
jgi:sulfur relay (sulfurtransferase) DsrF/TusC family protein